MSRNVPFVGRTDDGLTLQGRVRPGPRDSIYASYRRTALVIVKPETVIAWHRQGFQALA
jgi:hypothetical protein